MTKKIATIYAITDGNEDVIYIGVDTSEKQNRLGDHLKPSKIGVQPINGYMQTGNEWRHFIITEIRSNEDIKRQAHLLEAYYIEKYNPKFNTYLTLKERAKDIKYEIEMEENRKNYDIFPERPVK